MLPEEVTAMSKYISPATRAKNAVGRLSAVINAGRLSREQAIELCRTVEDTLREMNEQNVEWGGRPIGQFDSFLIAEPIFLPDLAYRIVYNAPIALQGEQADRIVALMKLLLPDEVTA
jgi:hypothetical protein